MLFFNISNHPTAKWGAAQKAAVAAFFDGEFEIVDVPLPDVPADADEREIDALANNLCKQVADALDEHCPLTWADTDPRGYEGVALVQGEFSLCYRLVPRLLDAGVTVVVACAARKAVESVGADGAATKTVVFEFVRFREVTR